MENHSDIKDWLPEEHIFENKDIKQNVDRIEQYTNVQKEAVELFHKKNQELLEFRVNYLILKVHERMLLKLI